MRSMPLWVLLGLAGLLARPAPASASLTEAARLAVIYDSVLQARFDEARLALTTACPPAPTEACRALLPLAFDGLGLHRIIGRIDARNLASANVLRRLGMRQEALLVENEWFKGEWTDEIDFGLLAREWRAAAQP